MERDTKNEKTPKCPTILGTPSDFQFLLVLLFLLGESMGEWDKDGCWEVKHAVGKGRGVFLSSSSSSSKVF